MTSSIEDLVILIATAATVVPIAIDGNIIVFKLSISPSDRGTNTPEGNNPNPNEKNKIKSVPKQTLGTEIPRIPIKL